MLKTLVRTNVLNTVHKNVKNIRPRNFSSQQTEIHKITELKNTKKCVECTNFTSCPNKEISDKLTYINNNIIHHNETFIISTVLAFILVSVYR